MFFFFQAEDGIRDSSVTGVQTCALPISLSQLTNRPQASVSYVKLTFPQNFDFTGLIKKKMQLPLNPGGESYLVISNPPSRSEERRVGKECRSRWSPYH